MKNTYAVYVKNANGWGVDCPDTEGVFFGYREMYGGQFCRHENLLPEYIDANVDLGSQGFVLLDGYRAAVALRDELDASGDWTFEGQETRPTYAICKLDVRAKSQR
jgi:hypothetical protein